MDPKENSNNTATVPELNPTATAEVDSAPKAGDADTLGAPPPPTPANPMQPLGSPDIPTLDATHQQMVAQKAEAANATAAQTSGSKLNPLNWFKSPIKVEHSIVGQPEPAPTPTATPAMPEMTPPPPVTETPAPITDAATPAPIEAVAPSTTPSITAPSEETPAPFVENSSAATTGTPDHLTVGETAIHTPEMPHVTPDATAAVNAEPTAEAAAPAAEPPSETTASPAPAETMVPSTTEPTLPVTSETPAPSVPAFSVDALSEKPADASSTVGEMNDPGGGLDLESVAAAPIVAEAPKVEQESDEHVDPLAVGIPAEPDAVVVDDTEKLPTTTDPMASSTPEEDTDKDPSSPTIPTGIDTPVAEVSTLQPSLSTEPAIESTASEVTGNDVKEEGAGPDEPVLPESPAPATPSLPETPMQGFPNPTSEPPTGDVLQQASEVATNEEHNNGALPTDGVSAPAIETPSVTAAPVAGVLTQASEVANATEANTLGGSLAEETNPDPNSGSSTPPATPAPAV